jgi:hypothetical protein
VVAQREFLCALCGLTSRAQRLKSFDSHKNKALNREVRKGKAAKYAEKFKMGHYRILQ